MTAETLERKLCKHYADRAGFVTNQPEPPYDQHRAHFGRVVCHRPRCIETAQAWVLACTGEPGVYVPYGTATAVVA